MKIIYKSFCPFPISLGAFAPWREEFPTPSTFDARLFAQAAQIFNYSNTKSTKVNLNKSQPFVSFVVPFIFPILHRSCHNGYCKSA